MRKLIMFILLVALALPGLIPAQGRRTPEEIRVYRDELADSIAALEARLADSLAARADTSVTNALQELINDLASLVDSLAAASAAQDSTLEADKIERDYFKAGGNITITEHGSPPDSATISASGGGGGGALIWWDLSIGPAVDAMDYDIEISDLTDSTEFTDSFQVFVDSLAALGAAADDSTAVGYIAAGEYIVCDTVLGPSDGSDYKRLYISGPPTITPSVTFHCSQGPDTTYRTRNGQFQSFSGTSWRSTTWQNLAWISDGNLINAFFQLDTVLAGDTDSIYFEKCKFSELKLASTYFSPVGPFGIPYGHAYNGQTIYAYTQQGSWTGHDRMRFENCDFHNVYGVLTFGDTWEFDGCRFTGQMMHGIANFSDQYETEATLVNNCVFDGYASGSSYRSWTFREMDGYIRFNSCIWIWSGTTSDYYFGAGIAYNARGAVFVGCTSINKTGGLEYFCSIQASAVFTGGYYHENIISVAAGAVTGVTVTDSGYIQVAGGLATGNMILGNAAYGINVAAGTDAVVVGNVGVGAFGTFLNDGGTTTKAEHNEDN